ncbi:MAG: sulfurtransferase TusA family protein [Gammaproteobacteria bacterium]|nr:sulfurtransferase TusA family protein [Gammaproteobacteria bacterium]
MKKNIDARHLLCPLPVIRLAETISTCQPKDEIEMLCNDPGVLQDIPAWCRVHGHRITAIEQNPLPIRITVLVA